MNKQTNRIIRQEDAYSIEYLINYLVTKKLLLIHKDIYALTINIENCLTLTHHRLSMLNRMISNCFQNAFCVLTRYKLSLYLSLGRREIMCLDEYMPTVTLQARGWNDTCLQIINLEQNYRWTATHEYNLHL